MDIQKILEAIKNGINASLIDFDSESPTMKKSKYSAKDIRNIDEGDYIYYDDALGYNNYLGDLVAVCAKDMQGNNIYIRINNNLPAKLPWADEGPLYSDIVRTTLDGYENTQHIKNSYNIDGTIWVLLADNEYIPSFKEMQHIYNTYINTELGTAIGLNNSDYYMTSSSDQSYNDYYLAVHKGYAVSLYKDDFDASTIITCLNLDLASSN